MPKWESLHLGVKKTHFFSAFLHNSDKFSSFFIQESEDACSNICRRCCSDCIIGYDTCNVWDCCWTHKGQVWWEGVWVWGSCIGLFIWAHAGNVTLLWAFKALSFLSVFLFLCLGCGFSYCHTYEKPTTGFFRFQGQAQDKAVSDGLGESQG